MLTANGYLPAPTLPPNATPPAKAEGITIFTIGLGEDLETEALRAIASEPTFHLRAPSAGELAAVYAEVARSIRFPAGSFWGGR